VQGGIARVGFFHFVEDYGRPIRSLVTELRKHPESEIASSLIVLPETFNLGRYYWDPVQKGRFRPTGSFLNRLAALSRCIGAVFVVGVLESTPNSPVPYNSAFLVVPDESQVPVLMSRKIDPDSRGLYQAGDGACWGESS
jgi:predicted amidohydrolase